MADEVHVEDREESKHNRYEWSSSDWSWHGSNSRIWGVLLILAGAVFMVQIYYPEIRVINAGNWWVIFILVPGIKMITRGWRVFRRTGRLWGPLLWGILLVGFALSQLFEGFGGEYLWPAILILGGLGLLLGGNKGS